MARITQLVALLAASASFAAARKPTLEERQLPKDPEGVTTITSPSGASIRFKQPGKAGICETKEGVDDYAGYISLNETVNMFFWYFEARENPSEKPLTLWLNGGPGADSLMGLFQENIGPCNVTEDLKTQWNPDSWNEASNMLFLSQPIGVGFSYETIYDDADGRWTSVDEHTVDTTEAAAVGAWQIMQTFLELLPQMNENITNKNFNLWTESYGGHYGPAFSSHFLQQNELIKNGSVKGVELKMDTLGIINGIIDVAVQAPMYPEFAINNTYGVQAVNETVYNFMKQAWGFPSGCRDQLEWCKSWDRSTEDGIFDCTRASTVCRSLVESPYYAVSGRGTYDIRSPTEDPNLPKEYFVDFLNLASTQEALGVNVNYTSSSGNVAFGFRWTGDFVYPDFIENLGELLDSGIRVALMYGDADYVCNWFGGEAVSLAINHTNTDNFRDAGYTPFLVDGKHYGDVREYGNLSFTRMFDAAHAVPWYQPRASFEYFKRVIEHKVVNDGSKPITDNYKTNGTSKSTHRVDAPAITLPSGEPTVPVNGSGTTIV